MRMLAILIATWPLLGQGVKPSAQKTPRPGPGVAWSYDTPRGFHLLEPDYRFPLQVKQALMQFVQPVPALTRDYQAVFQDKAKFSAWLKGVLIDYRTRRMKQAKSEGTVLSSDLSRLSTEGGTVLSTAKVHPRRAEDLDAVERYLDILKIWDAE